MSENVDYAAYRLEYGRIFSATLRNTEYIFRPLTVKEYEYVISCESYYDEVDSEALVVELTLLHPSFDYAETQPAGIITSLASEVLSSSGFASVEVMQQYMEEHRNNITGNVIEMMYATIISAIPTYSVEQLRLSTLDQLIYLVVMAENVIALQQQSMQEQIQFSFEVQEPPEEETSKQPKTRSSQPDDPLAPGEVRPDDPIADKLFRESGQ